MYVYFYEVMCSFLKTGYALNLDLYFTELPIYHVLTTMAIKIAVFCDVTPCGRVNMHRVFGETLCLHQQRAF